MSKRVLSLALKVTGDASGVRLTPVERALKGLSDEAEKAGKVFERFAGESEASAEAQAKFANESSRLLQLLKDDQLTGQQYTEQFEKLKEQASELAEVLKEAAETTSKFATEQDQSLGALEAYTAQLSAGAIDADVFANAVADAFDLDLDNANVTRAIEQIVEQTEAGAGTVEEFADQLRQAAAATEAEEAAAKSLADQQERANQIIRSQVSELDLFIEKQREFQDLLEAGLLPLENYAAAIKAASSGLSEADLAAASAATGVAIEDLSDSAEDATEETTNLGSSLQVLPGFLGAFVRDATDFVNNAASVGKRVSNLAAEFGNLTKILVPPLQKALQFVLSPIGALATALAAGGGLSLAVSALASRVEQLAIQAEKLGVSFNFIQVLDEAARRSNSSITAVSGAFTRLQRTIAGAGEESKKATAALAELGISFDQIAGESPESQYQIIGQALLSIEDPARRTAAAIELFGRSGASLIPFFKELPGAADDVERLGAAISDEDRDRLAAFTNNANSLGLALRNLGTVTTLPFVELFSGFAGVAASFINAVTAIAQVLGAVLGPVLDTIGNAIEALAPVLDTFAAAVRLVAQAISPIAETLLPALVVGLATLQIPVLITSVANFAGTIGSLALSLGGYTIAAGGATTATVLLATAIAATGIGAIVIGLGVGVTALVKWFTAADKASESTKRTAAETKRLADAAKELAEEDRKREENATRAIEAVRGDLSKAIDESVKFGQAGFDAALQYQTAINELQRQFDKGILSEESFKREAERASAAYTAQIDVIKKAAAETEAITKQVDELLAKANELPKVQQDLNAVESEIARVEAALVAARAAGQTEQADALVARLAQLDQLQAKLEDQADQADQGFANGFESAFASVDDTFNTLSQKAEEFGQAGFDAALRLKNGLEQAKEQVRDGILTQEAFDNEVERQKKLFEDRVEQLNRAAEIGEEINKKQDQLAEARQKIDLERAEQLARTRSGSVKLNDIREGGISAFFDALKEDPAVKEAKKQSQELEKIRKEITRLNAERVDILAGNG